MADNAFADNQRTSSLFVSRIEITLGRVEFFLQRLTPFVYVTQLHRSFRTSNMPQHSACSMAEQHLALETRNRMVLLTCFASFFQTFPVYFTSLWERYGK